MSNARWSGACIHDTPSADPCDAEIPARRVVKSLTSSWSAAERSFLWLTKIKMSGKEMKLMLEPSWIYHQVNLDIHQVENGYPSCMQDALQQRGNWLWWKRNFSYYCCVQWSEGGGRLDYNHRGVLKVQLVAWLYWISSGNWATYWASCQACRGPAPNSANKKWRWKRTYSELSIYYMIWTSFDTPSMTASTQKTQYIHQTISTYHRTELWNFICIWCSWRGQNDCWWPSELAIE